MKTAEHYLAQLMKDLNAFQHTEFPSQEAQDSALSQLLNKPSEYLRDMHFNDVETSSYWDCRCSTHHVHIRDEHDSKCLKCGTSMNQRPNSFLHDVVIHLRDKS